MGRGFHCGMWMPVLSTTWGETWLITKINWWQVLVLFQTLLVSRKAGFRRAVMSHGQVYTFRTSRNTWRKFAPKYFWRRWYRNINKGKATGIDLFLVSSKGQSSIVTKTELNQCYCSIFTCNAIWLWRIRTATFELRLSYILIISLGRNNQTVKQRVTSTNRV